MMTCIGGEEICMYYHYQRTSHNHSQWDWTRWIREESESIVSDLEEEIQRRKDLDDPFDGTASGIFELLEHDTRALLIPLPEETQTAKVKSRKIASIAATY